MLSCGFQYPPHTFINSPVIKVSSHCPIWKCPLGLAEMMTWGVFKEQILKLNGWLDERSNQKTCVSRTFQIKRKIQSGVTVDWHDFCEKTWGRTVALRYFAKDSGWSLCPGGQLAEKGKAETLAFSQPCPFAPSYFDNYLWHIKRGRNHIF